MSGYRREGHLGKEAEEQRRLEVASGSGSTTLPLLLRVGSQMMHCPPTPLSINQHWLQEGVDVKTMMNTWTLQKGFPLITITVRGRNVHMKQEHYMKGSESISETG